MRASRESSIGWALLLVATFTAVGCFGRSRAAELYPDLARHQNEEIRRVLFTGGEPYSADTLQTLIDTQPSRCSLLGLPLCLPLIGGAQVSKLDVEVVRRDIARLAAFYRREGYFGTRVTPRSDPADPNEGPKEDEIALTFVIRRGDPIQLDTFVVEGTEGVLDPDSLKSRLPLHAGQIFNLGRFESAADLVVRELQSLGYAHADVLRNYSVDTLANRATALITAIPGPLVRVDSIIVVGANHLGRAGTLRQLSFKNGDLLLLSSLIESQRNLYSLDIVQLASVAIAPDSLQATPADSATATVLINVAEAPVNQAEAAVGYGNVECFRTEGRWTNRSFTGGARRLDVSGSISKLGLGGFTGSALRKSLCQAFKGDAGENALDYRIATEFTQPYFLSPRNHLSMNVYAERVSEPQVYQRQAQGGQLNLTRRLEARRLLTGTAEILRSKTIASPVLFCSAFQICIPAEIDRLTQPRLRKSVGLNFIDDHTDNPLDPSNGHVLRSALMWATPWLASSVTFTRWTGEAAQYREVRRGWVFAGSVRMGSFFGTTSLDPSVTTNEFLPPEERFFAGGATTVRGFDRNALGRGVYVTRNNVVPDANGNLHPENDTTAPPVFVPTGGTSLGVVNAELRFPSPLLRRQLRLAAFVDGGAIGTRNIWNIVGRDWRFTPGMGFRMTTPVGPLRADVAYNPYRPVTGVLFHVDDVNITPVREDYAPPMPGFFGRLRVHVAIGQAF